MMSPKLQDMARVLLLILFHCPGNPSDQTSNIDRMSSRVDIDDGQASKRCLKAAVITSMTSLDLALNSALDFRNTNTLWASVMVETLARCGLRTAIVCPGSRSTPLTVALARHSTIEAIPVLDERSAAFFALGLALRSGRATAIVCTSGTAGANFFPAVIEAYESRVPLLILTADRPPELRQCNSGQAIDQLRLFGHYPNWQTELTVPQGDRDLLRYPAKP